MTKDEEKECYLFGKNMALLCLYSTDNNENFHESLKSLDVNLRDRILVQLIFFRSSFVASKIFNEIKNEEKSHMVADYFFSKLTDELKINSIALVTKKSFEYAEFIGKLGENSSDTIYYILAKSGVKPEQISEDCFRKFVNFLSDDLQDFWFGNYGINNMFELYKKRSRKNFGCLGSVLTLIFVICLLIYII